MKRSGHIFFGKKNRTRRFGKKGVDIGDTQVLHLKYIKYNMPTTKKRINITVTDDVEEVIELLAERDNVPVATKAIDLIRTAIELDEDDALREISEKRDTKNAKYISHDQAWL